jgi:hypothetical protein
MIYTGIKVKTRYPTKNQRRKFFSSVQAPDCDVPHIPYLRKAVQELNIPEFRDHTYRFYCFSGTKAVPSSLMGSIKNEPKALVEDFKTSAIWDLLDDPDGQYVLSHVLDDLYPMLFKVNETVVDSRIGKIGVIQEKGAKARFVAIPRLTVQLGSLPLGDMLYRILRRVPWDCTYDQESGAAWCQDRLAEGCKCFSVDLSDASNYFPLKLILRVISWIPAIPRPQTNYLRKTARGAWKADHLLGPSDLTWSRGIPLGMYSCFPAFALTHGLLLRSIELRYNLKDTFRVLGDDVVISNPLVHLIYRRYLESMGMPVSEDKTLEASASLAEYAGFVITPKSRFRPQKLISPTQHNVVEISRRKDFVSLEEVRNPLDLLLLAYRKENSLGLSLHVRAALRNAVRSVDEKFDKLVVSYGLDTFRQVKAAIMQPNVCDLTESQISRSDIEFIRNLVKELQEMSWQAPPGDLPTGSSRLVRICKCFGIEDTLVPQRHGEKISWMFKDDLSAYFKRASDARECQPEHWRLLKQAVKRQSEQFSQSGEIVKQQILSHALQILEET